MTAELFLPERRTLPALRRAAESCQGCELYRRATQTVFGEGSPQAALMLIGEQPGDQEDLAGQPFVGPAGRLLDDALREAGIDREATYVTNAVKHYKWEPRGKRRLHKKPSARELAACRPWLDAEFAAVRPRVVVCLGATAAQQLFGRAFRISTQRGEWHASGLCEDSLATWHPSAVLRAPTSERRDGMRAELIEDLAKARAKIKAHAP